MNNIQQLLDESINYEIDTYNVYNLFAETLEKDAEFWETLAEEELNHVAVLRKIQSFYQGNTNVIDVISIKEINAIQECRKHVSQQVEQFKKNPTSELACQIGIEIEKSVAEKNYQKFMSKVTDDKVIQLFQTLNGDEKDHLKRIQEFSKLKY